MEHTDLCYTLREYMLEEAKGGSGCYKLIKTTVCAQLLKEIHCSCCIHLLIANEAFRLLLCPINARTKAKQLILVNRYNENIFPLTKLICDVCKDTMIVQKQFRIVFLCFFLCSPIKTNRFIITTC